MVFIWKRISQFSIFPKSNKKLITNKTRKKNPKILEINCRKFSNNVQYFLVFLKKINTYIWFLKNFNLILFYTFLAIVFKSNCKTFYQSLSF